MSYIKREDALTDAMCVGISCQECPFLIHPVNGGCKIENYIKSIPAADVIERNTLQHTQCVESVENALDVEERKVGKWISSQGLVECGEVQCNQCKTIFYAGDLYDVGETVDGVGQASLPNYCPHCGAKME